MGAENEQMEDESEKDSINYADYELPRDLTAFQRDLLFVLASIDEPIGLRVADAMEALYRKPINHGQLYPNLDELDEMGLIDKVARDKRTNEYNITRRGRLAIDEYRNFVLDAVPE